MRGKSLQESTKRKKKKKMKRSERCSMTMSVVAVKSEKKSTEEELEEEVLGSGAQGERERQCVVWPPRPPSRYYRSCRSGVRVPESVPGRPEAVQTGL